MEQAAKQAHILAKHSLDQQGLVDMQLAEQVIEAFRQSSASFKVATLRHLKQLLLRHQLRQQATITSTVPLTSAVKQQLEKTIQAKYPQVKSFSWLQDQQLIGGLTVQVDDMWFDASIAHDLQTIREQLSK